MTPLLAGLAERPCAWMGDADGIVVSSRIRLARNLSTFRFRRSLDDAGQAALVDHILPAARSALAWADAWSLRTDELEAVERILLHERHLISSELAQGGTPGAALIRADERATVMINEEDHVRLQVLEPGLRPIEALATAVAMDRALEQVLPWAVHPRLGYLSSCPTNLGTGLRASVMLHLPALVETKHLPKVLQAAARLHLAVRGLYGEGSDGSGFFYQVSNQRSLGLDEESVVSRLLEVIRSLIGYEAMARKTLLTQRRPLVEDRVFRALAVLRQARILASGEMVQHLGWLRLGAACGLVGGLTPTAVDRLFVLCHPAHLRLRHPEADDEALRDRLRADCLRQALTEVTPA